MVGWEEILWFCFAWHFSAYVFQKLESRSRDVALQRALRELSLANEKMEGLKRIK